MTLDITTRKGWGADRGRTGGTLGKVGHVIIHHFYIPDVAASASRAQEASALRGVEDYHANLGWSAAPGYPWVVFDSGRVYEGVGWGRRGVHTVGYNSSAVAVCFANNGDKEAATAKAWQAAHEIVEQGIARGHIAKNYRLTGHRDHAAKSCPGNKTYPHLSRVRTGMDVPQEDDDMIRMNTKGDGQAAAAQVLANRALRRRHARMKAEGQETSGAELKVDDWAGEATFSRINWLLDEYFNNLVSRRKQEVITAGGLALLASIETIEFDRLRRVPEPTADGS